MNTDKIIIGNVSARGYTVTAPIVKEDYGIYLKIEGVELPTSYEVDFSNDEKHGTSITMIGNSDGVLIPSQFISTGKDIFAFLYHVGEDYGRTVYKFRIPNKVRPDRTNEQPTPEEQSVIDQAISALNTAVTATAQDVIDADASAQSASQSAENAHDSAVDAQNYAESASGYATTASQKATAAGNSADQAAQIKTDIEDYVSIAQTAAQTATDKAAQASQSANNASNSATTASTKAGEASASATTASNKASEAATSATSAQTAQTAAETAQGKAEDAQEAAEDAAASVSASAAQIATNTSDITALKEGLDEISEIYHSEEETVEVNVPLDLSDIRVGYRTSDQVGQTINMSSSSATTAILRAFTCEADKTYKLTITNGATPARIGDRGTIVIISQETQNSHVMWVKRSTNTANATDIVEFTPDVSGDVCFNLDMNYQSIAVTTTETHVTTEKTAVDKNARQGVDATTELVDIGVIDKPVDLDLNYIKVGKRSNEQVGNTVGYNGSNNGFNSSSATTCVAQCCWCEADKKYTLTITNGATPASIGERATVVIAALPESGKTYGHIVWVQKTTNTSNAKDIVEFTPTVSGYAFFNVDKKYQAIKVTSEERNIVLSAIDAVARTKTDAVSKLVLGNKKDVDITFEQGSFDASLADVSGSGYRSNVITGVSGCAVCIKVNPSYAFTYGDGVNALKTIYGIYVIHPSTDTIRIGLSDTPENVGFEMRIYTERGHEGRYDVIVAASDSEDADKLKADIVCDGTNDELDIQFAVNWNFERRRRTRYNDHCRVLLLPGTYNIDAFTQQYTAYGQLTREHYAVMFGNDNYDHYANYSYRISIEGCYETEHSSGKCATLINVTDNGVASLSAETLNSIFGMALLADGTTGAIRSNNISMIVRNLGFYTKGITNKIIAIDAYQAGNVVVENCDMWTCINGYQPPETVATAPEGSIGIRAGRGSCMGVRQSIKGNRIQGFHDGISLCGEHFIIQDNLEVACVYGFSTNQYPVGGAVQHPNIFIGNSVEQCLHMGRLGESGMRDTFIYIGGSVENMLTAGETRVAMLPIEISATTSNRGRIESDSLAPPYMESMFYEGYGQTFEQTIYPYYQA